MRVSYVLFIYQGNMYMVRSYSICVLEIRNAVFDVIRYCFIALFECRRAVSLKCIFSAENDSLEYFDI